MSQIRRTHRERIYQPYERILFSGQFQPRFIEETCACLDLSTYYLRPRLAHLRLPDHFDSLGPPRLDILSFVSTTAVYFRADHVTRGQSWLTHALESTTTNQPTHYHTAVPDFLHPAIIIALNLVDQTRLGPIKVHPVDFNNNH